MRWGRAVFPVLLVALNAFAGTPGSFRGVLYKGTDSKPGWWYVVGKNDSLRLVYVGKATVIYGEEVPESDRKRVPARSLAAGAEVRVTAEQDGKGAWRAVEVEILSTKGTKGRTQALERAPIHHLPVIAPKLLMGNRVTDWWRPGLRPKDL